MVGPVRGVREYLYVAICMGVLVKAGRNAGSVSVAVRSAARASGQTGEIRTTRDTHTANLSLRRRDRPQSLRTKRARPGRDAAAGPPPRLFAPHARPRRQCLRLRGGSLRPHTQLAGVRRACGGRRTRSRRACGGRQPHASARAAGSGSARSTACGANALYRAPGAAGGVVCTVGRRARWRAPRKGTQNKSLDAAVA